MPPNLRMMHKPTVPFLCVAILLAATAIPLGAQQPATPPPSADIVEILADFQQKAGNIYLLRGNVEIRYRGVTLTAEEITYDEGKRSVEARGQVVFEKDDDRVEASEARYDLRTGEGVFLRVAGTVGTPPRPSEEYLVTDRKSVV